MKTSLIAMTTAALIAGNASADLIAYWDQNSNNLDGGGFGFTADSFPQAADQGSGTLELADFDIAGIQSFAGTDVNAQPGIASGGSLSPQGGSDQVNNGMSILINVSTSNLEDIVVSWAQRGTGSGFDSRAFAYSTDGTNFTDVGTDTGTLSSSWEIETYDLSSITDIDDQDAVTFRITLDGATGGSGNNRFDNITVEGTVIPEPTSLALLGLGGLLIARRRRA